jgi:hypothetical protein
MPLQAATQPRKQWARTFGSGEYPSLEVGSLIRLVDT